jgi:hypothetical protein
LTTSAVTRNPEAIPPASAKAMKQEAQTMSLKIGSPFMQPPRITAFQSGDGADHDGLSWPQRLQISALGVT